jgi:alpha-beta hydrolase superfamily lysophospholipase
MTENVQEHHGYLEGVGRLRIHYRTWEAARPVAGLIVVHGLGDHIGRYEEFADAMAGHRVSTFGLDLRGHGMSEGRRGHTGTFNVLLQDLDRFRREVQGLLDVSSPLFILGHSMGGLIVTRYLEEYDSGLAGGIIMSPWLATAMETPRWKVTLATTVNRLLPALPFRTGLDPSLLSHDEMEVTRYREDPRVHDHITPRLFTEMSTAMGLALQRSDRLHVPLLFLLAGDDQLVDTGKAVAFARSLQALDVTLRVIPDAFHELLQESDRAARYAEIREWITKHLPD